MKKEIEQRTCDHCGNVKNFSKKQIGGLYFPNWISITLPDKMIVRSKEVSAIRYPVNYKYEFDCCSLKCAKELLASLEEHQL